MISPEMSGCWNRWTLKVPSNWTNSTLVLFYFHFIPFCFCHLVLLCVITLNLAIAGTNTKKTLYLRKTKWYSVEKKDVDSFLENKRPNGYKSHNSKVSSPWCGLGKSNSYKVSMMLSMTSWQHSSKENILHGLCSSRISYLNFYVSMTIRTINVVKLLIY